MRPEQQIVDRLDEAYFMTLGWVHAAGSESHLPEETIKKLRTETHAIAETLRQARLRFQDLLLTVNQARAADLFEILPGHPPAAK